MPERRGLRSGSWLVAGMFAFGLLLTAALYAYWSLHTGPFLPITESLSARWPESTPRVEGGKPRLDRAGEVVLRIVMRTDFDPADEPAANDFAREVVRYLVGRHDLRAFDAVEVHLFHPVPERGLSQRTVRLRVEDAAGSADDGGVTADHGGD